MHRLKATSPKYVDSLMVMEIPDPESEHTYSEGSRFRDPFHLGMDSFPIIQLRIAPMRPPVAILAVHKARLEEVAAGDSVAWMVRRAL